MTNVGFEGIHLVDSEYDWDPQNGMTRTDIWEGSEEALNSQAAGLEASGIRSHVSRHEGPEWRMRVFYPDGNDGAQEYTDTWERQTEWAQLDIRNNPNVLALAATSETLGRWFQEIRVALKDGQALTGTVDPGQQKLYDLYARGAEVYEVKRFVLRRRRTFAPQFAGRAKLDAVERIYTTGQLIQAFGIPGIVQGQLPVDPPIAPSDSMWGWRSRVDNSITMLGRTSKTEEVLDWVFAAWSTVLYNAV